MLRVTEPSLLRLTKNDQALMAAMGIAGAAETVRVPNVVPNVGPLYDGKILERMDRLIQENWQIREANRFLADQADKWWAAFSWAFGSILILIALGVVRRWLYW